MRRLLCKVPVVVISTLCLLLSGGAYWWAQANRSSRIRRVEHQNSAYYAALAQACDVFLKLKPLKPNALYVCEPSDLETSRLPSIITDLKPDRIIYTIEGVTIELGKDACISWERDKPQTNMWKMTIDQLVDHIGQREIVYREPSTKCLLASFGTIDEVDNVTPTNRFPHRVGLMYGWRLTVYSRDDKVRVKEVFELPEGATWTGGAAVPDGITLISDRISPSGNCRIQEFDLTVRKGYEEAECIMPYRVLKSDPTGKHKISVYLEGQLIKEFTFQVENEQ